MAKAEMIFPQDFLWGTATAALQVEGNNVHSDWWQWEQQPGRILQGDRSGLACNWWENAEADLDLAAEMGTNAHRMSLEWSRIEPVPSLFDEDALERYRQILKAMHARGLEPMVTLHHFSNPVWLVERGDFNSPTITDYFQRYVSKVVAALGDLVPKWITINEPMVYVFYRYLQGAFPAPQKQGWVAAFEGMRNLMACHAVAYHQIKEQYPQALVGMAKNVPVFEFRSANPVGHWWAKQVNRLFNELWMQGMVTGKLAAPVGWGRIRHLAGSFDFVGINYYTRFFVKFPPIGGLYETDWGANAVVSDGNYGEVYPAGLFKVIQDATQFNKPIYITENGLPDRNDHLRPGFLLTHLREVWRAISFNYPVMGYYHWSLTDNFEWDRGWTQRFGLIEMNPETQERSWRRSGRLYQEMCRHNSITSEMVHTYAPDLIPILFPG